LTSLIALFIDNLLPIFLAVGAGFLAAKYLHIDPRPLSQVTFFIFSPCLIFNLLVGSSLSGAEILRTAAFAVVLTILVGLLTWLAGRAAHLERRLLAAVLISTMFMNAGNYGLPVVSFVFGETALAYASLFFVTNIMLAYSAGVVIASLGASPLLSALGSLAKVPALYGLLLALVCMALGWQLPLPLDRTVDLLGQASIPSMLILVGMQLYDVRWSSRAGPLALVSGLRLVVAPLLALGFGLALNLHGPAYQASISEAAMPSAVLNTLLATQYDLEPDFVTAAVFVTTLLSPLTLTPLLAYLGG